jgi:cation diffusion facilitator CzcD-associated flavoprotein CzcO
MKGMDTQYKVAIIGAGPSGLAAAKALKEAGVTDFVVFDKNEMVGGNWIYNENPSHSSVFETTHIISSKKHSQYSDFPMPDDYPDYPSHKQLLKYFNDYARHFDLISHIRFKSTVTKATLADNGIWQLSIDDNLTFTANYLIVANGHHWDPRMPEYPGTFSGKLIHSHDFKNAKDMAGKRVLVVGGGNSACDVAVETSRVSEFTAISMRRGYYIVPKFMFGKPVDVLNETFLKFPLWIRKPILKLGWRLEVGKMKNYGLEEPDYPILKAHPVTNSELLYFLRHGKIHARKDILELKGNTVLFSDGKSEEYDIIIACTGYKISFPFFDTSFIHFDEKEVPLYLRTFHPKYQNLFFVGLVQPQGCIWPLAEAQSKLVASLIVGKYKLPSDIIQRVERELKFIRKEFLDTPRHSVEVHFHEYLNQLKKEYNKNVIA